MKSLTQCDGRHNDPALHPLVGGRERIQPHPIDTILPTARSTARRTATALRVNRDAGEIGLRCTAVGKGELKRWHRYWWW